MEIVFKERLCDTTDEYIAEIESCVEQIRIIAETATNECPVLSKENNIRVGALNSTVVTLCKHCDGIIQNYYLHKATVR